MNKLVFDGSNQIVRAHTKRDNMSASGLMKPQRAKANPSTLQLWYGLVLALGFVRMPVDLCFCMMTLMSESASV